MAEAGAYGYDAERAEEPPPSVTLVAGTSFVVCSPAGTVRPQDHAGYFAGDTRLLSALDVHVDGQSIRLLDHHHEPTTLTAVGYVGTDVRPSLAITSTLQLGEQLSLTIGIEHLEPLPLVATLSLEVDADFADVFDVKQGTQGSHRHVAVEPVPTGIELRYEHDGFERAVQIAAPADHTVTPEGLVVAVPLGPRGRAELRFEFVPLLEQDEADPPSPTPTSATARSLAGADPAIKTAPRDLGAQVRRGVADLRTLLLDDPDSPDRPIVAAGSPWFLALFGRDSIITAWQSLPLGTELAVGVLEALAARQGRREVTATAEQPGRILHEVRRGEVVRRAGGWGEVYYGSADATPLFVMLLAEAWRWGAPTDRIAALLPAAERAVEWIDGAGDPDGNGFVETSLPRRGSTAALVNQSWKDSDDSIRHPDGRIATPPVATVEVQGYCEAAERALADLRDALGDGDGGPLRERAARRRDAIDAAYWLDDERCHALALDADGAPVASPSSNAGHLLWSGSALPERRQPLGARLMEPDLFSGRGIRTLAASTAGYNPLSYHCGSVWPHDSAIVAAGMLRSGCDDEGQRLATAISATATQLGGRLPELLGGFDADRQGRPVPYPTACMPQAWAAGTPLLVARSLLGIDPDLPRGVLHIEPRLPDGVRMEVRDIPLGAQRLDVVAVGDEIEECEISGPGDVVLSAGPRAS